MMMVYRYFIGVRHSDEVFWSLQHLISHQTSVCLARGNFTQLCCVFLLVESCGFWIKHALSANWLNLVEYEFRCV